VVAGAITTLALAPFDIWPLALLAVGLFYAGLRELSPRQALGRGWCFGFGLFGAGTSWIYYSIHHFGGASVLLAGFLMLLFTAAIAWFFALPAWLWARWLRRNEAPLADALAFAALWVGQEAFAAGSSPVSRGCTPATASSTAPGRARARGRHVADFLHPGPDRSAAATCRACCKGRNGFIGWPGVAGRPWVAGMALKHHAWTSPSGR
jgi:apolipoprotein N-acyltransferase